MGIRNHAQNNNTLRSHRREFQLTYFNEYVLHLCLLSPEALDFLGDAWVLFQFLQSCPFAVKVRAVNMKSILEVTYSL